MIVTPAVFTPIHDEEASVEASFNEQTVKKIIRNINFLGDLVPLGTILTANINQVGAAPLDPNVWQLCDGSEITNSNSPLRTIGFIQNFVPNIDEKYIKAAPATTGNAQAGTWTFPVGHDHGGNTGDRNPSSPIAYEKDEGNGVRRIGGSHTHSIGSALGNINIDFPKWLKVAAYMKIQ